MNSLDPDLLAGVRGGTVRPVHKATPDQDAKYKQCQADAQAHPVTINPLTWLNNTESSCWMTYYKAVKRNPEVLEEVGGYY